MDTVTSPDGTPIAYDRSSADGPLVLVGGAFSYRRSPGQVKLAGMLSARFTVLSCDRRGRGDIGDTAPYAAGRKVEDLAAVVAAAGGHAHVWGLSSGAELTKLKQQPGGPIAVGASGTLVRYLLTEGLLDELQLLVHPVLAGPASTCSGRQRPGIAKLRRSPAAQERRRHAPLHPRRGNRNVRRGT